MNVRERFCTTILALAFALCVPATRAQESPPVAPEQPGSRAPQDRTNTPPAAPLEVTSDTRPLSGAEQFTLGQMAKTRNYVLVSGDFYETADSNAGVNGSGTNFDIVSSFSGHIELHRVWARYELMTDYIGGGSIYKDSSGLNSTFHQFGLTQKIAWPRWSLKLNDYLSYLPVSSFGFLGYTSGLPGTGVNLVNVSPVSNLANVNPLFIPNETIFTVQGPRIGNTVLGEVDYKISPRSSFTATGSYGILHFSGTGFINSNNVVFLTGYSHDFTAKDSIGVIYGFSRFWFTGTNIDDHSVQLAYGRRLTGRLALQLSAGPAIYMVSDPVSGSGRQLTWTALGGLTYGFQRSSYLTVSYATYLTSGSGALTGAQTHSVQMTATRPLSRMWAASLDAGFSHNTALQGTTTRTNAAFNTWYGGPTLSRPLGRHTRLYFNYYLQRQTGTTNASCITGGVCSSSLLRHLFGVGVNFHSRPYLLD